MSRLPPFVIVGPIPLRDMPTPAPAPLVAAPSRADRLHCERALILALARRWSSLPPDVRDAALAWTAVIVLTPVDEV